MKFGEDDRLHNFRTPQERIDWLRGETEWRDKELLRVRKGLKALEADNARLRVELNAALNALREAPNVLLMHTHISERTDIPTCGCTLCRYFYWYNGQRQAALGEGE